MKVAYLGIGSNKGDREQNLLGAVEQITLHYSILDYSSIYKTSPIGYKGQADFFNMVVKVDTDETSPLDVLATVKQIEKNMGRVKTFKWGPRLIDIDILHIDDTVLDTDALTLPHREMFKRNFVLIPLSEITDVISVNGQVIRVREAVVDDTEQRVRIYKKKQDLEVE
jgi:2-amino-4-hydroxy-6-hydroxymethyldihydropteridine diphosphokinase